VGLGGGSKVSQCERMRDGGGGGGEEEEEKGWD
jgi:hypothetical protein